MAKWAYARNTAGSAQWWEHAWWIPEFPKTLIYVMLHAGEYWIIPDNPDVFYSPEVPGACGPFPTLESAQAAYLLIR